jgi:pyruvate, orthophosphate dikinase
MAKELIYKKGWSPQEMEFTFEGPTVDKLYILQTRDMAIRGRKEVLKFDLEQNPKGAILLGHGIGVAGGAMSGRVVFSLDEIDRWRYKEPDTSLILVRGDTVPDDIREIFAADGLLTARGGLTSHAAVVAHRLGKVCVAGCENLICNENDREIYFNQLRFRTGDFISIDGQEGSVFQGFLKVKKTL